MFKYMVMAILFLGTGVCTFSAEKSDGKVQLIDGDMYDPVEIYHICANNHLFLGAYDLALEDLNRASFLIKQSEQSRLDMEFIINMEKAIIYDCLNLPDECERTLGALIILSRDAQSFSTDDDEDDDDDDDDDGTQYIMRMIELAPSADVREVLINILKEINEL